MGIEKYRVEVADQMLMRAGRLDVEECEYICFQSGQPRKVELEKLLKERYPDRDYMIIQEINGQTIMRLQDEC